MQQPFSILGASMKSCNFMILATYLLGIGMPEIASAQTLPNGGMESGAIAFPGQENEYTFSASAGDSIHLSANGDFPVWMRIYYPDGSYAGGDFGYADTNVYDVLESIEQSGTYTVVIQSGSDNEVTGNYDLYFVRAPGANEHGSLSPGGMRTGSVSPGDLDSYTFSASAGDSIHLSANGDFPVWMRIYYPDGSYAGGDFGYADTNVYDVLESVEQSGTYTVVIQSGSDNEVTGNYDLHFVRAPGANEHGTLSGTGIRSGSITRGDLDSYAIIGVQGGAISITVSGSMPLWIRAYRPDGGFLASDSGSAASTLFLNQTELAEAGFYTLVIQSNSDFATTGSYSLQYDVDAYPFSYAALGDSYSSGEGVFPFLGDFGFFSACNRSARAYSTLVRLPFSPIPLSINPDAEFDFYACTGAVTNNVRSSGEGQYGEPPQASPSQIDDSRDLITITIGGNDVYFARILGFCMLHDNCNELRPFDPYTDLELGDLFPLWVAVVKERLLGVFQELRQSAPNATIIALDYPLVVSGNECPNSEFFIGSGFYLSANEQAWMRQANRDLNRAIQEAAAATGIHFVSVEERFEGHGVCGDADDWIYGVRHFWPQGWFHPNAKGQREYARAVNDYLDSIKSGWAAGYHLSGLPRNPAPVGTPRGNPDPLPGDQVELPIFGELAVSLFGAPVGCDSIESLAVPGRTVNLLGAGFAPGETVTISINLGNQSFPLGTAGVSLSGMLDAPISVPFGLPPTESASIQALGAGVEGHGLLLTRIIELAPNITEDVDADGIPDTCDNCPLIMNPGQANADGDEFGDSCDPCPDEASNDEDEDGLCAAVDPCPSDPDNDMDGDGICASEDNCAVTFNPDQEDLDGDGIGDVCQSEDCYAINLRAVDGGRGEIFVTSPSCGDSRYFAGAVVAIHAQSYPGQFFIGWTGDIVDSSPSIEFLVDSDLNIFANFCDSPTDSDGDLIGDNCDNCPLVPYDDGLVGDIDGNGLLNADDVIAFSAVLLAVPLDPIHMNRADVNCDGETNGRDIQLFLDALAK